MAHVSHLLSAQLIHGSVSRLTRSVVVPLLLFVFFSLCRSCAWKTYVNVRICSFMKWACKRDVNAIVLCLHKCLSECSEQLSLHRSLSVQV